jgi:hypothetical protein
VTASRAEAIVEAAIAVTALALMLAWPVACVVGLHSALAWHGYPVTWGGVVGFYFAISSIRYVSATDTLDGSNLERASKHLGAALANYVKLAGWVAVAWALA